MELNKEIVGKFLKNQCTDPEAAEMLAYLKEHPDALEYYLPVEDWLADEPTPLNIAASERILGQIRANYQPEKRVTIRRHLIRYAVAASLTGMLVLAGIKWFTTTTKPSTKAALASHQGTSSAPELKMTENKTKKLMRLRLSDSSMVTLYPNSSLQYLPGFENDKRDLYLKGKAQFKIHKDPLKPFTVYMSGIATTVLGTRFLVTEQQNKKVSVMLMEGMVRVWSKNREDSNRSVLLNPGDEIAVTGGQFSNYSLVHNAGENRDPSPAGRKTITKKESVDSINTLVFKNNKLKDLFEKIEKKFGVTINNEKARGIKEKLFTGQFLENDSLDFIVTTICNWYDLQYRIEGNIVTITAK